MQRSMRRRRDDPRAGFPGGQRPAPSGSLGRPRLSFARTWNPRTNTVATNTLDALRQRLAAAEPELRRRGIRHLAVFGSVARGDDRPDSDVEAAVEIEAERSFSLIRMEETRLFLEDALRRRVDLGEIDSFRPHVRAAFEREWVAIF
jgi:predicted nucleotidyltransferase